MVCHPILEVVPVPHHAPAVNNTMLIQIALLAWAFLGESLGGRQIAGLVVASLGTLVVQVGAGRAAVHGRRPA